MMFLKYEKLLSDLPPIGRFNVPTSIYLRWTTILLPPRAVRQR